MHAVGKDNLRQKNSHWEGGGGTESLIHIVVAISFIGVVDGHQHCPFVGAIHAAAAVVAAGAGVASMQISTVVPMQIIVDAADTTISKPIAGMFVCMYIGPKRVSCLGIGRGAAEEAMQDLGRHCPLNN